MTTWDPEQYLSFSGPRTRAALDLLDRVPPIAAESICDLGCGTGHITRMIAERWPGAAVVGLDNSAEMLDKAMRDASASDSQHVRAIEWLLEDITTWRARPRVDLLYSNATLHWLGDHQTLFPQLLEQLRPGGILAVQMPLSWYATSHRLMREVLESGGSGTTPLCDEALRQRLASPPVMQPQEYWELLEPLTRRIDIFTTEYLHVLEGEDPVLEWVSGTGLRPILQHLRGREREQFIFGYRDRLREAYPQHANGKTLYPFARVFIVATV